MHYSCLIMSSYSWNEYIQIHSKYELFHLNIQGTVPREDTDTIVKDL